MTVVGRRLATALAGTVALAFGAVVGPARGESVEPVVVTDVGWWTLATGAPKAAGGFQVAQAANGSDQSVAAIKVKVNSTNITSALFVLNEATSSFRSDGSGVTACRTTTDWKPANPGLWIDVPKRDCTKHIQMVRSATQQAWSANLLPLLGDKPGTVSIVFVPGTPAPPYLPVPSLETLPIALPSLPLPVVGGVPIPPPVLVEQLPPLPKTIAFPVQLGFMVDISSVLSGAIGPIDAPDESAAGDLPDAGFTGGEGIGGFFDASPPLADATNVEATAAAPVETGSGARNAIRTASEHDHRPWGRAWGFAVLAILFGAGVTYLRRFLSERFLS
jgi:hypothetical protein